MLLFSAVGFLTGCSHTKYLGEGEELYTGAELRLDSDDRIAGESRLQTELEDVIRPEPNDSFLGLYKLRLWFYNIAGEPRGRGLRYWIKNRLGQPPVLLSQVNPVQTAGLIRNRLENNGFLNADVGYEIMSDGGTSRILYTAHTGMPYLLGNIIFPHGKNELETAIDSIQSESDLGRGERFDLDRLRDEIERIDAQLKERGFFYFNPDYLRFIADTSVGDHIIDLYLTVNRDAPVQARNRYSMRNIYIYPGYTLEPGRQNGDPDTVVTRGVHIIDGTSGFRPEVLAGAVFLRSGMDYNRHAHVLTINRFMGLGTFKFVSIRFNEPEDSDEPMLDAHIFLTPADEKSLRVEVKAVSKSNDFAGPGLSIGFTNRNVFGGAEMFSVNLISGIEAQIGRSSPNPTSYEFGIETELQIPRIISPVKLETRPSLYVPRTRVRTGYSLFRRPDLFRLDSFSFLYGYVWTKSLYTRHELNPVTVKFYRPSSVVPEFRTLIDANPILRRSFEAQFIIGSTYSFFYNDQIDDTRRNHWYLNFNLDLSGNTLYLLRSLLRDDERMEGEPQLIFGTPFSQYIRGDFDLRYYLRSGRDSRVVFRLIAGVGVPYGNSRSLPYVKQYFTGGTNSIRAFAARTIGPGSYRPPDGETSFLVDRTGDIRLEFNTEYRFPIVSVLKGALFLDMGNVWHIRNNADMPGAAFTFDSFTEELAMGAGLGLRLDITFFVLRLDVAFPLHIPYLPRGERWVGGETDFGSARWRKDNLVFNIAIGYPF